MSPIDTTPYWDFQWMKVYGLDGVLVRRSTRHTAPANAMAKKPAIPLKP